MFKSRLHAILIVFMACWLVLVVRLFQLQVVEADFYQGRAQDLLTREVKYLEPIRGRVLDRRGRVLASDEPAWAISLHYGLLSDDPQYYRALASQVVRSKEFQRQAEAAFEAVGRTVPRAELIAGVARELRRRVEALWPVLAEYTYESQADLRERAASICRRVAIIKEAVEESHGGLEMTIEEEIENHPVVPGLDHDGQVAARKRLLDEFEWLYDAGAVSVTDDRRRMYHDAECVAHILGRTGSVQQEDVDRRPFRADDEIVDWGGYRPFDQIGITGVEWLCETQLRGVRGRLVRYYDERAPDRTEPVNGRDVRLSIDYDLQRRIFELLRDRVLELPLVPGGCVVVLDIPTREVLAMASYPAYDPNEWNRHYAQLRADTLGMPLRFRAVATEYAPGSIIKPITIAAALGEQVITPASTIECSGVMFPSHPDRLRCWIYPRGTHGLLDCVGAIKNSCNVFCFNVADRLGAERLCTWFEMFGVGQSTGIGLLEERRGILPTAGWLAEHRGRSVRVGDGRNYAIGQGELLVTPLQAANLAAAYASGRATPLRLVLDDQRPAPPGLQLPVLPSIWSGVRRGLYQVVNEPGGTAVNYARVDHPQYVVCGKSGSAEASRWVIAYNVRYEIGGQPAVCRVPANTAALARAEFERLYPQHAAQAADISPAEYWPAEAPADDDRDHSHAWFIGYIQEKTSAGAAGQGAPRIAIAVLLEFGGSGGRTSGPLFKDIAELIIEEFEEYIRPGASLVNAER